MLKVLYERVCWCVANDAVLAVRQTAARSTVAVRNYGSTVATLLCISRGLSLSLLQILSVAALFRCSADRNFYFAHFASTIGNEATRLDTAASDNSQSVLFVCVCRLGPWHATEVGRALNRGSGPNQAQARKRPDRSTTTQTCF